MRRPGVKQPPGSESAATIRNRGAAGAVLLTARQAAQVVAFIGTLLARLLTPTTLGMMALATTVATVGTFFADGGLGAALGRKTEDPSVDELRTRSRHATRIGVGLGYLGLSPPFIRADLRSIVCRLRPRA
jgi:O-antigen/teichoic acid export membrane protein